MLKRAMWCRVCLLVASTCLLTIAYAQDSKTPGKPAGTPGAVSTKHPAADDTTSKPPKVPKEVFEVLDFVIQAKPGITVDDATLGRFLADQVATNLAGMNGFTAVRKRGTISDVALADPLQTRALGRSLGAHVLVVGKVVGPTANDPSVSLHAKLVNAENAAVLGTAETKIGIPPSLLGMVPESAPTDVLGPLTALILREAIPVLSQEVRKEYETATSR
jgi:hypothetical protein